MTANRWWVRWAARWAARFGGAQPYISMFSLAVTAFSTFSIMLQGFGLGRAVPYVGAGAAAGLVAFAYLYAEGGVWNQVQRDRQDLSNNFAGPNSRIQAELNARAFVAAQRGAELDDEEREAVAREADATFSEYRDGVAIEE